MNKKKKNQMVMKDCTCKSLGFRDVRLERRTSGVWRAQVPHGAQSSTELAIRMKGLIVQHLE